MSVMATAGAQTPASLSAAANGAEVSVSADPAAPKGDAPEPTHRTFRSSILGDVDAVSVIVKTDGPVARSSLERAVGGKVIHEYTNVYGGFSMILPADKVTDLAAQPGVVRVSPDVLKQPQTEVSPGFIGAPNFWAMLGGAPFAGQGVVVGVIDTGIWPEHSSFSDPDPLGKPYPTPPASWTGTDCEFGSATPGDDPFTCNDKLIGATYNMATYAASGLLLPTEFVSARDDNGHGTHTASTAAGNFLVSASIFGIPRGLVSGISPRSHVAAYKACGDLGCFTSDLVDAIDSAVADGVDVINYSIGGGSSNPFTDDDSQAFLDAYDAGVFVATSAGNSGPGATTVGSPGDAPWLTTVGASTTNRHFISRLTVTAPSGRKFNAKGASVTGGVASPTPIVMASDFGDGLCLDPFPPGTFSGEIVVCERGVIARVSKSFNVAEGGASGLVLYNPVMQGLATDNHFIPSVHLESDRGTALVNFLAANPGSTATLTQGRPTKVLGDMMAAFSSRGPLNQIGSTIKPDVTAPGVQILAGNTPLPATETGGLPGQLFQSIQGTSMSSPHAAGAGALLTDLHPDWTPAEIKSALMLTAKKYDVFKEDGVTPADAFDMGAGRIDLDGSYGPGNISLVMDVPGADYFTYMNNMWNVNLPSVFHPNFPGALSVDRTMSDVSGTSQTWDLWVDSPADFDVSVPATLATTPFGDSTFSIDMDARDVPQGETRFATVYMESQATGETLHIPVAIIRGEPGVTVDKTCSPAAFTRRARCEITVENTTFDPATFDVWDYLPANLRTGGRYAVNNTTINASGSLFAAGLPVIDVDVDPHFGFLALSDFGISPAPCPSNCDDGAFTITGLDFNWLGTNYDSAIWSVNGTLELGTASGLATSFANQDLPDPAIPNNLLAPWWTDLNLGAGGTWTLGALTDGVTVWDIFEWKDIPRFGDAGSTFSFQIWLERGGTDAWFAYDGFSGDTTDGTVGAENPDGTVGEAWYYDGAGTTPWGGPDLGVAQLPGTPGETKVIAFNVRGISTGTFRNYAELTSDAFEGTNIDYFDGEVLSP